MATFWTKTLNFSLVRHLHWLAKLTEVGTGPLVINYVVNYRCKQKV